MTQDDAISSEDKREKEKRGVPPAGYVSDTESEKTEGKNSTMKEISGSDVGH